MKFHRARNLAAIGASFLLLAGCASTPSDAGDVEGPTNQLRSSESSTASGSVAPEDCERILKRLILTGYSPLDHADLTAIIPGLPASECEGRADVDDVVVFYATYPEADLEDIVSLLESAGYYKGTGYDPHPRADEGLGGRFTDRGAEGPFVGLDDANAPDGHLLLAVRYTTGDVAG
ncbi:hypothetical protein [Leucobacter sp. gxy201]|uniref:hypothetical protein n=1 Tax=Leucobacter sp. gxy201 TaxID=2957200 RepID=UPI003DA0F91C